jgi:hypothetical protein
VWERPEGLHAIEALRIAKAAIAVFNILLRMSKRDHPNHPVIAQAERKRYRH